MPTNGQSGRLGIGGSAFAAETLRLWRAHNGIACGKEIARQVSLFPFSTANFRAADNTLGIARCYFRREAVNWQGAYGGRTL